MHFQSQYLSSDADAAGMLAERLFHEDWAGAFGRAPVVQVQPHEPEHEGFGGVFFPAAPAQIGLNTMNEVFGVRYVVPRRI